MKVTVVARHMEVTSAMREYALERVEKLPHYYDGLMSVDVTFDMEAGQHTVEVVASGKKKSVFVVRHRGDDMYACMDQAMHKLEEQLRRHKDRIRDRHAPPAGGRGPEAGL